jgi:hypothetical protein
MLDQLIAFTNQADFWGNWHLRLEQAEFHNDTLNFIVSTIKDDYPPAEDTLQWWLIECKGVVSESGIGRLNLPNYRMNLLSEHPFLWQYEESKHLLLKGKVQSLSHLLGDLFLAHIKTCGNWLDFNGMVAGLHWRLQKEGEAEMLLPHRLLKVYQPILEQHGLNVIVEPGWEATPELKMLLIGNPLMSEDAYRFGQVYVVAKEFSAKTVAPNSGLAKAGLTNKG